MVREMHHDVLEFEISMDNQNRHHIIKTSHKLIHDCLYNAWTQLIIFELHNFFKITSVAKLHKNVISCIGLNGLTHFNYILALDAILILNFTDDQFFLGSTKSWSLHNFAGVKLWVGIQMQLRKSIWLWTRDGMAHRSFVRWSTSLSRRFMHLCCLLRNFLR